MKNKTYLANLAEVSLDSDSLAKIKNMNLNTLSCNLDQ